MTSQGMMSRHGIGAVQPMPKKECDESFYITTTAERMSDGFSPGDSWIGQRFIEILPCCHTLAEDPSNPDTRCVFWINWKKCKIYEAIKIEASIKLITFNDDTQRYAVFLQEMISKYSYQWLTRFGDIIFWVYYPHEVDKTDVKSIVDVEDRWLIHLRSLTHYDYRYHADKVGDPTPYLIATNAFVNGYIGPTILSAGGFECDINNVSLYAKHCNEAHETETVKYKFSPITVDTAQNPCIYIEADAVEPDPTFCEPSIPLYYESGAMGGSTLSTDSIGNIGFADGDQTDYLYISGQPGCTVKITYYWTVSGIPDPIRKPSWGASDPAHYGFSIDLGSDYGSGTAECTFILPDDGSIEAYLVGYPSGEILEDPITPQAFGAFISILSAEYVSCPELCPDGVEAPEDLCTDPIGYVYTP